MDLDRGTTVAEVYPTAIQTRVCQKCGFMDTDAYLDDGKDESMPCCEDCGSPTPYYVTKCKRCDAEKSCCEVLSYTGCQSCKPEARLWGRVALGPATGVLARAGCQFTAAARQEEQNRVAAQMIGANGELPLPDIALSRKALRDQPCFHIVEEPGGILHLTECEIPTEEYNRARTEDLRARHPKAHTSVVEHAESLETFLDVVNPLWV